MRDGKLWIDIVLHVSLYICMYTEHMYVFPTVFLPGASALHLIEQNFNKRKASSDRSFKFSLYYTTRQNSSFPTKDSRISYR